MTEVTSPRFLFLSLSNVLSISGLLKFVWLEERKNERMENWENRIVWFSLICVWLEEWKHERVENSFVWLERKVGRWKM